jgi:anti-anti-sigma factor
MELTIEHPRTDVILVKPQGRIDVETAPTLRDKLKELSQSTPTLIVVDMKGVEFIDSSGLAALVSGLKALREQGGSISLSRPHPQALTALRLTLLDRVFPIFSTVEDAIEQANPLLF